MIEKERGYKREVCENEKEMDESVFKTIINAMLCIYSFELVGQNVVKSSKNHRVRKFEIPQEEQINVKVGDVIGFFLPRDMKGGITLDKCDKKVAGRTYGSQLVCEDRKRLPDDWAVGEVYTFKPDSLDCKIISIKAYVI